MREVEPQVFLIGKSIPDVEGIESYLKEVGADLSSPIPSRLVTGKTPLPGRGVSVLAMPAEVLIEFAGRLCYRSWEPGLNPNVSRVREEAEAYFANLLASGHGSVLEHASFSFVFHNVSRVFTHELVRHRAGTAISQESMRFVRLDDIPFWMPEWVKRSDAHVEWDPGGHGGHWMTLEEACRAKVQSDEAFQAALAEAFRLDEEGAPFHEKKAKTSFMRRFAPDGVATGIVWTANVRALRHVISMRTAEGAEEEIRLVFDQVGRIMQRQAPLLFGDFEVNEAGEWVTPHWKV